MLLQKVTVSSDQIGCHLIPGFAGRGSIVKSFYRDDSNRPLDAESQGVRIGDRILNVNSNTSFPLYDKSPTEVSDILRVTKNPYVLCFERQSPCEDSDALLAFLSCPVRCKVFLNSVFVNSIALHEKIITTKSIRVMVFAYHVLNTFKNMSNSERKVTSSKKEIILFCRLLNSYFPTMSGIVVNPSHVHVTKTTLNAILVEIERKLIPIVDEYFNSREGKLTRGFFGSQCFDRNFPNIHQIVTNANHRGTDRIVQKLDGSLETIKSSSFQHVLFVLLQASLTVLKKCDLTDLDQTNEQIGGLSSHEEELSAILCNELLDASIAGIPSTESSTLNNTSSSSSSLSSEYVYHMYRGDDKKGGDGKSEESDMLVSLSSNPMSHFGQPFNIMTMEKLLSLAILSCGSQEALMFVCDQLIAFEKVSQLYVFKIKKSSEDDDDLESSLCVSTIRREAMHLTLTTAETQGRQVVTVNTMSPYAQVAVQCVLPIVAGVLANTAKGCDANSSISSSSSGGVAELPSYKDVVLAKRLHSDSGSGSGSDSGGGGGGSGGGGGNIGPSSVVAEGSVAAYSGVDQEYGHLTATHTQQVAASVLRNILHNRADSSHLSDWYADIDEAMDSNGANDGASWSEMMSEKLSYLIMSDGGCYKVIVDMDIMGQPRWSFLSTKHLSDHFVYAKIEPVVLQSLPVRERPRQSDEHRDGDGESTSAMPLDYRLLYQILNSRIVTCLLLALLCELKIVIVTDANSTALIMLLQYLKALVHPLEYKHTYSLVAAEVSEWSGQHQTKRTSNERTAMISSTIVSQMLCMPWPFVLGLFKSDVANNKYHERADLVLDLDSQTITSNKKYNSLWASTLGKQLSSCLNVLMRGNVISYAAGSMAPISSIGSDSESIQCGPILHGVVNYCRSFVMKLLTPVPLFRSLLNHRVIFDLGLYREYLVIKAKPESSSSSSSSSSSKKKKKKKTKTGDMDFFLDKFTASQAFCEFVGTLDPNSILEQDNM